MQGAKELRTRRGRSKGTDAVDIMHIPAEKSAPKTMPQSLHRTPEESRMFRDLVWFVLSEKGLGPTEIELACKDAYRDRSVISKRLPKIKAYYEKMRKRRDGGLRREAEA